MVATYPIRIGKLQEAALDDETLIAIGRLIRAFAQIEDLITLHIGKLTNLNEYAVTALLGRTAVTRRLAIAELLASMISPDALKRHKGCFNAEFTELQGVRNAVAHGALVGKTDSGEYAFMTGQAAPEPEMGVPQVVECYTTAGLKAYAEGAEKAIPQLVRILKLQPLLQTRTQRVLGPHSKAQPQRKQSAKPKRPPQSPRG